MDIILARYMMILFERVMYPHTEKDNIYSIK
jgi:hypothetical protein